MLNHNWSDLIQVDGKRHSLPEAAKAKHEVPWNKEVDLNDYYTAMDKRYY